MNGEKSETQNFFEGLLGRIEEEGLSYVVNYFRQTPTGQKVEQRYTSAVISDYLKNPVVLIVIIIVLFLIFRGFKRG